jgi:hypothetical protein
MLRITRRSISQQQSCFHPAQTNQKSDFIFHLRSDGFSNFHFNFNMPPLSTSLPLAFPFVLTLLLAYSFVDVLALASSNTILPKKICVFDRPTLHSVKVKNEFEFIFFLLRDIIHDHNSIEV